MTQDEDDDWFDRMRRNASLQSRCSLEEREAFELERKASEGTMWEWAQMQSNGDIAVRITECGLDGDHGMNDYVVLASDPRNQECRTEYDIEIPGEVRLIKRKWVGSEWVLESTEKMQGTPAR